MEPFEYKGYWWLPENSENCIAGILRFDGIEQAKLELFGALIPSVGKTSSQAKILGVIPRSYVTLLDCILVRENPTYSTGVKPLTFTDFLAHRVFISDSFIEIDKGTFKSMRISYFNLPEWVGRWGWKAKIDEEELKIENRPSDITATVDDANISIQHQFRRRFSLYDERNRKFKPDSGTLWEMIQALRFIVEVCLLTELGIPQAKVEELMGCVAKNRFPT